MVFELYKKKWLNTTMSIFERMFNKEENPLRDLHPNFRVKYDSWYANRYHNPFIDGQSSLKVRFSFDDPKLLDDFPFLGKIGMNLEQNLKGKFIGFAYGQDKDRQTLEEWAKKFPYAEIIIGLDHDGVIRENSQVIKLTE